METNLPVGARPPRGLKAGQFSLRTIFVITAVLAFVMELWVVLPDVISGPAVFGLVLAVPSTLAVVAKYGSGSWPAFCIGAIVPTGMSLVGLMLAGQWSEVLSRANVFSPSSIQPNRWDTLFGWIKAIAEMGRYWLPVAILSWFAAVLIGILCVGVRRIVQRRD
jgi:hypothetical protein